MVIIWLLCKNNGLSARPMHLSNTQLTNFINRIKLQSDSMGKYRDQVANLKKQLGDKIRDDDHTGIKVSRVLLAGSWKKRTILRRTTDKPIDIDLVLFVTGDESLREDVGRLHDFVVSYLEEIYPSKDISRDVDAEKKTKAITIRFVDSGLHVDIVPVVPLADPVGYVWQPERGGGGRFITSVDGQLANAQQSRERSSFYTAIVRAAKWWRNNKELEISSFTLELIAGYLDEHEGASATLQEGILRFFRFLSDTPFPVVSFPAAINAMPRFDNPVFVADPTNNENNAASKLDKQEWADVVTKANEAYDDLHYALAKPTLAETVVEWKRVFGPSFNIEA